MSRASERFERRVRAFLSARWNIELHRKDVNIKGRNHNFDFVSKNSKYIGDAKYYKWLKVPAAKYSAIAEKVWLLEKTKATHKFMVFGKDKRIPHKWLERHRALVNGVKFYFFDGKAPNPLKPL